MEPCGCGRSSRVGWTTLAVLLLSGCPQLLRDDFALLQDGSTADSVPGGVPLRDAGPDLLSSGGSGGSRSSEPDTPAATPGKDAAAPDAAVNDAGAQDTSTGTPVDAGTTEEPNISALRGALVHRYRFDPGATLVDSVGGADAVSVGVTFSAGAAVFAGTGAGQYLDLPNNLLSGLTNTTFETWVIWTVADPNASTSAWQRIFDFGSNSSTTEGEQGSSANDIFLSPQSSGAPGKLHVQYKSGGNVNIDAPNALPTQVQVQIDVVLDENAQVLSLYQDGALVGALSFTGSLTTITYLNNWLGRSQYTGDPPFQGQILDFRIYSAALTTAQIQTSHTAGPDADL
jgi:hypothetical protein